MLAIASLIIILTLSITVTKVATIILKHTGLSEQSARFQARSAFTGVGFTTKESEKVVNHPVRRKTLMVLMLLGNMGIVTSMSSLLIAFVGQDDSGPSWLKIFMIMTGIVGIWTMASSAIVEKYLSIFVEKFLKRYTSLEIKDYASLLHLQGNYRISEQAVTKDMWICDKKLKEIKLWKEGILLLGIKRADGEFIGAPMVANTIHEGDELILYGHLDKLRQLAEREYGIAGDFAHKKAALERRKEIKDLKKEEIKKA
ncbi:MAG: potassium transporter TrkA [Halobacteriovoraceae bacterium]|nr:potassium transporter TrkA [Halobacteriovoraceae bacterium]